jgi:hypothetical protein
MEFDKKWRVSRTARSSTSSVASRFWNESHRRRVAQITTPTRIMKKSILVLFTIAGLVVGASSVRAEGGKEVTLKGQGTCAKCGLKQADSCQNVLVQEKNGKKTTFFLVQNEVSKKFHTEICTEAKAITVVGVCKKVGDKFEVTPSKITAP